MTCPCSAPWRTRPESPRPPSASANASRRMDLPAPVSPVSTARPRENSISSRSIRTMSRIDRRASMRSKFLAETHLLEGPGNIGTLVLARLETTRLYKIIGVLVPAAVRKIVPKYGRRRLRLADDADRHIGLGQPRQRFLDVPRGLIAGAHSLEAIDCRCTDSLFPIIAVDILEFLRGRLVILALVHQVQALVVELVRGFLVEGVGLGGELVPERAGAAPAQGNGERNQARRQPQRASGPCEAGRPK